MFHTSAQMHMYALGFPFPGGRPWALLHWNEYVNHMAAAAEQRTKMVLLEELRFSDYMWLRFQSQHQATDHALMRHLSHHKNVLFKREFEWERKELAELFERAKPAIERADTDTDRLDRMQRAVEQYKRY